MGPEIKPDESDSEDDKVLRGTSEPNETRPGVGNSLPGSGQGHAATVIDPRFPSRNWASQE